MFSTKHLEGRLRYETDKVVCIDVHIKSYYLSAQPFVTQVLISLINGESTFFAPGYNNIDFSITSEDVLKEINEGILQYACYRKKLGLPTIEIKPRSS